MIKRFILPKISNNKIIDLLKNKLLEDTSLIDKLEMFLIEKRGYVYKLPLPGDNVILSLSGGLDTTIIWDILMRIYKLNVYPVFFRRGQIRVTSEESSVDFFTRYYEKKFPMLFHSPMKLTTFIPPLEIRWIITKFGSVRINKNQGARGIPLYSSQLVNYAVQYSYYLEITKGVKARNIFFGYVKDDGINTRYETLTALRVNTLNVISLTGDPQWQITSIPIEKNLRFHFGKEILVKYADKYNIPIEKSFSCIKYCFYHCGKCIYCLSRKRVFKKARIKDKTIYLEDKPIYYYFFQKILLSISVIRFMLRIIVAMVINFIYFLKTRW